MPETAAIAEALGLDPLGMLASGSLLAAAEPNAVERLLGLGFPVSPIGELTDASHGFVLRTDGVAQALPTFDSDETARVLGSA
jgi:hydrogenase maturation factor